MPEIKLRNITKRWGKFYAVDHLNLDIENHSFVTLLGPSGCGKTTILRMIAGLETPTSGQIMIGDKVVFDSETGVNIPANKRKVGFLFQNYALWPNMTVYQNISFGLSNMKEEMHRVDIDALVLHGMLKALEVPKQTLGLVESCRDKQGKLDEARACVKLIDRYQISIFTAKKLLGLHLNQNNYEQIADEKSKKIEQKLNAIKQSYETKGQQLNDQFEIMADGRVLTEVRKLTKEEVDLAVRRVARVVKISMFMDRYPAELSGGQQQRVAIARTLAPEPEVLFMDEPLSNLDAKLRLEMRYELQRLHVETGRTFVYVTHDQMEAMTLATKICLINNGVLQQYDAPLTIYGRPNNLFVADFVGNPSINFIEASVTKQEDEKSVEDKDGSDNQGIPLTMLNGIQAVFHPQNQVDLNKWFADRDTQEQHQLESKLQKPHDKKQIEKGNKDEVFRYHIAKVVEEDDVLKEEKICTNQDFVLGVRPEALKISDQGLMHGIIYGAMLTGMESTIKIRVGDYLLTSVAFGSTIAKIGSDADFTIEGKDILLFDRKSGQCICAGSLE